MNETVIRGEAVVCSLSTNWWTFALRGVLALLFAVLAALMPASALLALAIVFGAFSFVDGIFSAVAAYRKAREGEKWGWLALSGFAGIAVGAIVAIAPLVATIALAVFLWWMIAFWAVAMGTFNVLTAIRLRKFIKGEFWLGLIGVSSILLGFAIVWMMFAMPAQSLLALGWLLAFYAALLGGMLLAFALRLKRLQSA